MHNPGSAANAATDILGQDLSRTSLTNDYKAADNASAARSHHVKTRPPCASTPHRVSTDHAAPARRASPSCASLPRRYFGMAQGSLRSSSPPSTWGPRSNRRIYDQAGEGTKHSLLAVGRGERSGRESKHSLSTHKHAIACRNVRYNRGRPLSSLALRRQRLAFHVHNSGGVATDTFTTTCFFSPWQTAGCRKHC